MTTQAQIRQMLQSKRAAGKIKDECDVWAIRIDAQGLTDRQEFIDWMEKNFTVRHLALFIDLPWDCDSDDGIDKRGHLHEAYLESKFGS